MLLLLPLGQYKKRTQHLVAEVCCKNWMIKSLNAEQQRGGISLLGHACFQPAAYFDCQEVKLRCNRSTAEHKYTRLHRAEAASPYTADHNVGPVTRQ
jgi:hypothetical protein